MEAAEAFTVMPRSCSTERVSNRPICSVLVVVVVVDADLIGLLSLSMLGVVLVDCSSSS